jgi:hypothetical protein
VEREVTFKLQPGQFACIVSSEFAGAYRTWSDPVEVLVEPSRFSDDPDVVDMTFRYHECPEIVNY